jgi:hypothetical protein
MSFSPPAGVTFHPAGEISASDLCELLQRVVAFLQGLQLSSPKLYHDWWQHDGLHFDRGTITFHDLFMMVETPRAIFEGTPSDDEVFVGVAPENTVWYLRFRAEWDAEGKSIVGSFAVTVPMENAPSFATKVAAGSRHRLFEEPARTFYERVIV